MRLNKAVFLDRDGVLLEDRGYAVSLSELVPLGGVAGALNTLKSEGYLLIVVTNQAVVARGLLSEAQLRTLHLQMNSLLVTLGAPHLDAIYACPHHPNATDPVYRQVCSCRKPRPGLILSAAAELGIDLSNSYMVGDRLSDVAAGQSAGCRSILVTTGKHLAPPIESGDNTPAPINADHVCADLPAAVQWILNSK